MKTFLSLIILSISFSFTNAQWYQLNPSPTSTNLKSVFFINNSIGWIGGSNGTIFKTIDGGKTWNQQSFPASTTIWDIQFISENVGLICTGIGKIFKTTNGGTNWIEKFNAGSMAILDLHFLDGSNAYAAGGPTFDYARFFKSTDGGENWTAHAITLTQFTSVCFVNSSVGYIASAGGEIIKTINGGSSWDIVYTHSGGTVYNLQIIDNTTCYATGPYSHFIYSHNSGSDWGTSILSGIPDSESPNGMFFINGTKGWVVSSGGYIVHTTDGGLSWNEQTSNTTNILNSVFFVDTTLGFITGDGGAILSTSPFTDVEQSDDITLKDFCLLQNYPNPFNPSTSIQYAIGSLPTGQAGRQFVQLKVYDVLGNEVATLVNEYKSAGSYEVEFNLPAGRQDPSSINYHPSSGVYFYQLKAGDFFQTKKMLLIK